MLPPLGAERRRARAAGSSREGRRRGTVLTPSAARLRGRTDPGGGPTRQRAPARGRGVAGDDGRVLGSDGRRLLRVPLPASVVEGGRGRAAGSHGAPRGDAADRPTPGSPRGPRPANPPDQRRWSAQGGGGSPSCAPRRATGPRRARGPVQPGPLLRGRPGQIRGREPEELRQEAKPKGGSGGCGRRRTQAQRTRSWSKASRSAARDGNRAHGRLRTHGEPGGRPGWNGEGATAPARGAEGDPASTSGNQARRCGCEGGETSEGWSISGKGGRAQGGEPGSLRTPGERQGAGRRPARAARRRASAHRGRRRVRSGPSGNGMNPRVGCRMQQACGPQRGASRRSREERQGRNESGGGSS